MKKIVFYCSLLWLTTTSLQAQIINGLDTLYGNEWINFDQPYFKILLAEDGMYKVDYQQLQNAGMPVDEVPGGQYQLFHNGAEVPIYTSTDGIFTATDHFEFYGKKNRSELDRYLFADPDNEMMNPRYSLFTDTSAYFLTWTDVGTPLRYEEVENDLSNVGPKEEWYWAEEVNVFNTISYKESNSQGVSVSNFNKSEGFSTNWKNIENYQIEADKAFIGGAGGSLIFRYSGNLKQHDYHFSLNGQLQKTKSFYGYEVDTDTLNVDNSLLTAPLELTIQGMTENADNHRMAFLSLEYPRLFDFNNATAFHFKMEAAMTKKYLEVQNFNTTNGPLLFDITNFKRQRTTYESGLIKIGLTDDLKERSYWLINEAEGFKEISLLTPVNFIDYSELNNDFVFLTNKNLFDDGNGVNYIQSYVDYRSSVEGGSFNPIVVEIQQIYDQFGWGINRHSLSLKNFAYHINESWDDLKYLFIIGKGREYDRYRKESDILSSTASSLEVPTFGKPGSDNQLVAGPDGFTPIVPIGRIAATNGNEIKIYLNKVIQFEANRNLGQTIESRAWMKNVLHMGGGLNVGEQTSIKNNLLNLENEIENNRFGGEVKSFFKTSSDPIQVSQTDQIFDFINSGVSLITFFGHSAVGTFDFSIDNPDNYKNFERYPLIISLGCYSGNIHTGGAGLSERFSFFEDKGAIAFLATAGQGYISSLQDVATKFYDLLGGDLYGESIGTVLQSTNNYFGTGSFGVNLIRQQFNYHGDPSLALNPTPGPDYTIDATSLSFTPQNLTTQLETFDISFDVVNLGTHDGDSMLIKINQILPDGSNNEVVNELVETPPFSKNYTFKINSFGIESLGFNRFEIEIDQSNRVAEKPFPTAENNNKLLINGIEGIEVYITDNSAVTIYPPEFSIVSDPNVVLKSTTSNLLLDERKYIYEVDTSALFNSPFKVSNLITQSGGVIKWQPTISWEDDVVYYWRISPDSLSPQEGYNWDVSSFVFLGGSGPGWNQSHRYQWERDEFVNMELSANGEFKFLDDVKDVYIKNGVNTIFRPEYYINNILSGKYRNVPDGGIYALVFDSTSVVPWTNHPPGQGPNVYGIPHPQGYWVSFFLFTTADQAGRQQLIEFLENVVPTRNYVALFTVQKNLTSSYFPEDWEGDQADLGTDLFEVLESQGASLIRNTIDEGSKPYVFAFQKDVGPIIEELADSLEEVIEVNFGMPGYWDRGEVISVPIGPAKKWTNLDWSTYSSSLPELDTITVDLIATNPLTAADTVLLNGIDPGNLDLSFIDASQFPFIKLRLNSEDSLSRTSAQLDYWRVSFEGYPDFAINPHGGYEFNSDTLLQGETLDLSYVVENLSDFDGDSLDIEYIYNGVSNNGITVNETIRPLSGGDSANVSFNLDSRMLAGEYAFSIELNPDETQMETTKINNYLSTKFVVEKDERNPVLEVTFDGRKIINGDLISSKPLVQIALQDENEFLALDDTSSFKLFLIYPGDDNQLQPVYFNNPLVRFEPADVNSPSDDNKALVEFRPQFDDDGIYQLIVQAQDITGNQSGEYDYKVSFEIINKSSISNLVNYPNPFTTSTRFVYTMTGNEQPERYKIQIMTASGRVVRELSQDEIGPLNVGTHQTDFAWDGTDQFGDQLAKGVYLYRFLVENNNGEQWDEYETGADNFVKAGIGKMVLLR